MSDPEPSPATHPKLIGLMPAGGKATRLGPLPFSKELYPIASQPAGPSGEARPKVACQYLLESMRKAGVGRAHVIIREGKWDIPGFLTDGAMLDMHLAYLMMDLPHGVPYTLDQAYPFVKESIVVFGFPDILFQPEDAFGHLLNRQEESGADLVLGLFPAANPEKVDMVDLEEDGGVRDIVIKPAETDLRYTWINAVWTPGFTEFLHSFVASDREKREAGTSTSTQEEVFLGQVILQALQQGLKVETVLFPKGSFLDIGTPEDLRKALRVAE